MHLTDEFILLMSLRWHVRNKKTGKSNDVFQDIIGSLYSNLPYHLGMLKKHGNKIKIIFMFTTLPHSIVLNNKPSFQIENCVIRIFCVRL